MPKIIRAYELQIGDCFIKQGSEYIVKYIRDGKIAYFPSAYQRTFKEAGYIGVKSQERVELVARQILHKRSDCHKRPTTVYTKDWDLIGRFDSIGEAAKAIGKSYDYVRRKRKDGNFPYRFEVGESMVFRQAI